MANDSVALVLLAAGQARRFGGDKLRAGFAGSTVLDKAMTAAEAASFDARYLVVTPDAPPSERAASWQRVVNPDADSGVASSIRAGVTAASSHSRLVIALADMPFVTPHHLDALATGEGVLFTRQADGRSGSPAAFPREAYARLLTLDGDRGAAALDWLGATLLAPDDADMLQDIDTPNDLEKARRSRR